MLYREKLKPETFIDDEPVGIASIPSASGTNAVREEDWVWIPERLFERILWTARGYGLHLAEIVDIGIESNLSSAQAEGLVRDLEFLRDVLQDDAVGNAIAKVIVEAQRVATDPKARLAICPP